MYIISFVPFLSYTFSWGCRRLREPQKFLLICKCVLQIRINWLTVCDRMHRDGGITQLFHSVISVNLFSVTSICLLNLSRPLFFLSYTESILVYSLVAMLHHVLWLCVCSVTFCTGDAHHSYDTHMMTTQCGAFRVCSINFCAWNTHTTLASITNRCGTHSGSPQKFTIVTLLFIRKVDKIYCNKYYLLGPSLTTVAIPSSWCISIWQWSNHHPGLSAINRMTV